MERETSSWFSQATRGELLAALEDAAKLWLAHDGLWFQAVERHRGLREAIELDIEAMSEFARLEAERTARRLAISCVGRADGGRVEGGHLGDGKVGGGCGRDGLVGGGPSSGRPGELEALARALDARLYALINPQRLEWEQPGGQQHEHEQEREQEALAPRALVLRVLACRVQAARRRKGLADFPCKPVGLAEYSAFAAAIDPSIHTECVACPPDPGDPSVRGFWCAWRFTVVRKGHE